MKLHDVVEMYCYEHVLSDDSVSTYRKRVKAFELLTPYEDVTALRRDDVFKCRDIWMSGGLRNTTINNYVRHCRVIYQFSLDKGIVSGDENIFSIPRLPELRQKRVISENTIETGINLLSERDWFWKAVLTFQAELGIRNRQLVNVRYGDINLEQRYVKLRADGNKLRRENVLPLCAHALESILKYLELSKESLGRSLHLDEYLFEVARYDKTYRRYSSGMMSTAQLQGKYARLSRTIEKITGERISGHRLRHTLATRIGSRSDVNVRVIQEWFGWSCIQTAQNYIQVSLDQKRALIEAETVRYGQKVHN